MGPERIGDHRVQVHGSGGSALGLAEVEAAVPRRRVAELLNHVQLLVRQVQAALAVLEAERLPDPQPLAGPEQDHRPIPVGHHVEQPGHVRFPMVHT